MHPRPCTKPTCLNVLARCALLIPVLGYCGTAATAAPPPPDWYHYSWSIPIEPGNWYSPLSTLGYVTFGITEDSRSIFDGTTYFFDDDGDPVTQVIGNGVVQFNDDGVVSDTGVIASVDFQSANRSDGPCRGCPDHPYTTTFTNDQLHMEWTGPRAGTLTVNGVTQDMVQMFTGLPLVYPTDFSGTWIMVWRFDELYYGVTPNQDIHYEKVAVVNLTAVTAPRTYTSVTDPLQGVAPYGSVALPPPGAYLYDVTCAAASPGCDMLTSSGDASANQWTMWFDDSNAGRFMDVRAPSSSSGTYVVADKGQEVTRVYGTEDRIVARRLFYPDVDAYGLEEFAFFRIDPSTLTGAWRYPPCSTNPNEVCNPSN